MKATKLNRELWLLSVLATEECNLNCSYCYIKKSRKNLSLKTFEKALNLFFSSPGNFKKLLIGGGEITISPEYFKKIVLIIKKEKSLYKDKKIKVSLTTNLTFLNKSLLEIFKEFDEISVSLDGKKKSHDINREYKNDKDSFKDVFKNFKKLLKISEIRKKVRINKIISPNNVEYLVSDIKFLSQFNSPIYFNIALGIEGWKKKEIYLLKKNLNLLYKWFKKNSSKKEKCFASFFKMPIPYCPYSAVVLNTEGETYPCEYLAVSKFKKYKIQNVGKNHLTLDNLKCVYFLRKEECSREYCLKCDQMCLRYSFPDQRFINETDYLSSAKKFNNFILSKYIKFLRSKISFNLPSRFIIKGDKINKEDLSRIDNFLITLIKNFSPAYNPPFFFLTLIFDSLRNKNFVETLIEKFNLFDFSDWKIETQIKFLGNKRERNSYNNFFCFVINLDNSEIFLSKIKKGKKETIYIGNLYEGIFINFL